MKALTKEHTLFCKGIAIFIMLFHHLFYRPEFSNMYYWIISIDSKPLIQYISYQAKICVAIFVFLSAYGLTISYKNKIKNTNNNVSVLEKLHTNFKFVIEKIKKLYILYWPIFIICIVIGWISKTRIPTETYATIGQFIRDFFGIAYIIDGKSPFIGAWWYISFALVLYIAFPALYKLMKKFPKTVLIISFIIGINAFKINIPIITEIQRYLFISCLGIFFANNNLFIKIFEKFSIKKILLISILLCMLFFVVRCKFPFTFDGFFTISIIVFSIAIYECIKYIRKFFIFFGKHSANIFLIHGIIYRYWLFQFIYRLKYPIVIFTILLLISLAFSIIIEYSKNIHKIKENILKKLQKNKLIKGV